VAVVVVQVKAQEVGQAVAEMAGKVVMLPLTVLQTLVVVVVVLVIVLLLLALVALVVQVTQELRIGVNNGKTLRIS
jgi:hypothetical protein